MVVLHYAFLTRPHLSLHSKITISTPVDFHIRKDFCAWPSFLLWVTFSLLMVPNVFLVSRKCMPTLRAGDNKFGKILDDITDFGPDLLCLLVIWSVFADNLLPIIKKRGRPKLLFTMNFAHLRILRAPPWLIRKCPHGDCWGKIWVNEWITEWISVLADIPMNNSIDIDWKNEKNMNFNQEWIWEWEDTAHWPGIQLLGIYSMEVQNLPWKYNPSVAPGQMFTTHSETKGTVAF